MRSFFATILSGFFIFGIMVAPSFAAEYYVGPDGTAEADGSEQNPWSLRHALSGPSEVQPGDTIWVQGGVYSGEFVSELEGTQASPITVRAVPGERAQIDGAGKEGESGDGNILNIFGDWTVFWGLEVMNSDPIRFGESSGPWVNNTAGGIKVGLGGSGNQSTVNHKLINMIVHNNSSSGIASWWSDGSDEVQGEIYGNLVFNNGRYSTADGVHGHGFYIQNKNGQKAVENNIFINNFDHQMQFYGSENSYLENVTFQKNTYVSTDTLIGGNAPVRTSVFTNNYLYGTRMQLGWTTDNGPGFQFANNYVGNGGVKIQKDWPSLTFSGNTITERKQIPAHVQSGYSGTEHRVLWIDGIGSRDLSRVQQLSTASRWNDNAYFSSNEGKFKPFNVANDSTSSYTFDQWKSGTGFDASSTHTNAEPSQNRVFVEPNRYEDGRGHVIVYNWEGRSSVSVDISSFVQSGSEYTVYHAADYFGSPVTQGTYEGGSITIPMNGLSTAEPINNPPGYSYRTYEDGKFGAFIVRAEEGLPQPSPTPESPSVTPTPTPESPSVTPIPTVIPTVPPEQDCPRKGEGDADCDGDIDLVDLEIYRQQLNGLSDSRSADFDEDGEIDLIDFWIWRTTYTSGSQPVTPPPQREAGTYILQWGTNGQDSGKFPGEDVVGMAIDNQGNLYVGDSVWNDGLVGRQQRVQHFSPNGFFRTEWGNRIEAGRGGQVRFVSIQDGTVLATERDGSLNTSDAIIDELLSLDVAKDGTVYVLESGTDMLLFDQDGNTIETVDLDTTWLSLGTPDTMQVTTSGSFWILNRMTSTLDLITDTGTKIDSLQVQNDSAFDTGDAYPIAAERTDLHDEFFVANQESGIIASFGADLTRTQMIPAFTYNGNPDIPSAIETDGEGNMYVAYPMSDTIRKLYTPAGNPSDPDYGKVLAEWGSTGRGNGQFQNPTHIAVGDHYVYVYDAELSRVQKFAK